MKLLFFILTLLAMISCTNKITSPLSQESAVKDWFSMRNDHLCFVGTRSLSTQDVFLWSISNIDDIKRVFVRYPSNVSQSVLEIPRYGKYNLTSEGEFAQMRSFGDDKLLHDILLTDGRVKNLYLRYKVGGKWRSREFSTAGYAANFRAISRKCGTFPNAGSDAVRQRLDGRKTTCFVDPIAKTLKCP